MMNEVWMVRAGQDSVYIDDFLEKGMVAIGWGELGQIDGDKTKPQILQHYKGIFPDHSDSQAQVGVSQVLRFIKEIKIGDTAITYDRNRRVYYIGEVLSEAIWSQDGNVELAHIRKVKWVHLTYRDGLTSEAKNTLGAIQTLFQVKKQVAKELQDKAKPLEQGEKEPTEIIIISQPTATEELFEQEIRKGLIERTEEAIEERIIRLDWANAQELFAGILRAMGYRTTVSPRGADRGFDIFASPDGLGLQEPRIFVEVKHRPRPTTSINSQAVRSFLGGRSENDKCLFVSTGGFTKDARYEAERSRIPLQLINLTDLRRLLVDNYDKLDEKTRSLIPLQRIYVLAE